MDLARALAAVGYVALAGGFAAAAYVGVVGPPAPVPAVLDPAVAWIRSVPPAGFLAGLALTVWGFWRLAVPA
jgi:hypothetical protein